MGVNAHSGIFAPLSFGDADMSEHHISLYTNDAVTLYVKESDGVYKIASDRAILAGARISANALLTKGMCCDQPDVVKDFLIGKLSGLGHEVFACLFLDNQLKLMAYKELFNGSIKSASFHVREVAKVALKLNASALIFAHNHPSGAAKPSQSDLKVTYDSKEALAMFDIRVADHLIVAANEIYSFAENGDLWS